MRGELALGVMLAGASLASGCARDSLADRAYEAPVDANAAPTSEASEPSETGGQSESEPDVPYREGFSVETESLCDIAICSFRDKVEVERALDEARISARAERDDSAALAALADAFEGPGFKAGDAIAYFETVDPPSDDLVAQMSRVLARIHDVLDATQRDALAAKIASDGPKQVLGIGRRGFGARPERAKGERGEPGEGERPRRGKGKGGPDLERRQHARVERMCEVLACTASQRLALIDRFAELERKDFDSEIASMNLKLAVLFRADAAPPEAVARQLRALREMNAGRDRMRAELFAALHRLLSPEQRSSAAARMRTEPPGRALGLAGPGRG